MSEEQQAKAALCAALMVAARNLADMIRDEDAGASRCVALLDEAGPLAARLAGLGMLMAAMETVNRMMAGLAARGEEA